MDVHRPVELAVWGLPEPSRVRRPAGGTNNTTLILDDTHVLRIYQNLLPAEIAAEHRLLNELNQRGGLPFTVPAPRPTLDGRTVHDSMAIFPFVPGQRADESLESIELAAEALGVLDQALAEVAVELAPRDWRGSLEQIHPGVSDLEGACAELERRLGDGPGLRWFRESIGPAERLHAKLVRTLPVQIVHGDYSLWNVLVHEGRVSAVLDFEVAHLGLRLNDPVAAVTMATGLGISGAEERLAAFLRGYARSASLSAAEEEATPAMLRYKALYSVVWRIGRWRLGLSPIEEITERLADGLVLDKWLARSGWPGWAWAA
ncbi:phosphotransferase enzyme family protein [Streptomyces sp. PT12]|uniref:phosphotransferase enzyme family protein n=1 Tax=Streptomyces sp. PT12 TaxID=1510197 RepID=UPI0015EEE9E6|nr:phosphotransferase [Streptomyces sp. PT12]